MSNVISRATYQALIIATLFSLNLFASSKATQMIRTAEQNVRGNSLQALMTMKIIRSDFERTLKLRSWSVASEKAIVEILDPPKEEGVISLRANMEMWNYLPKVDQTVKVPMSMMLQSWMGSDFTNDDLMKASSLLRDYHHKILKKQTLNGHKTQLIECKPKKNAPVVWGKVLYWVRTKDNLPVKEQFFDEDLKWVRTIHFSEFKKMDDRVIPTHLRVETAEDPKKQTIVTYSKVLYDRALGNDIFEKTRLRTTSQEGKHLNELWYQKKLPKVAKKKKNKKVKKVSKTVKKKKATKRVSKSKSSTKKRKVARKPKKSLKKKIKKKTKTRKVRLSKVSVKQKK